MSNRLHRWIIKICEEGHVPQAWKDANIVTIYKIGDRTEWDNYHGISPLSAAGKIFAGIQLNRLSSHTTQGVVPKTKYIEQGGPMYIVFVGFTTIFNELTQICQMKDLLLGGSTTCRLGSLEQTVSSRSAYWLPDFLYHPISNARIGF